MSRLLLEKLNPDKALGAIARRGRDLALAKDLHLCKASA